MSRFSFSREPAAWIGALTSVLLVAADFGFHLSGGTVDHLLAAVPLLMALFIRQTVTPNASVPTPPAADPEPEATTVDKPIEVLIREAVATYQRQITEGQAGLESIRGVTAATIPPPVATGG